MARRVGSAKAEKVASRLYIGRSLYKYILIVNSNFVASGKIWESGLELGFVKVWPIGHFRKQPPNMDDGQRIHCLNQESRSCEAQGSFMSE
jgi:hypothetical protein